MIELPRATGNTELSNKRLSRRQLTFAAIVFVLLALIGLRVALPTLVKDYLNRHANRW